MARPDNSVPPRPATVPDAARWDPKEPGFEWVHGEVDADGRRHGAFKSWTREGLLHGESHYDHGRVHGKNSNFHPDGTTASEADWVAGVIMDSAFHRSAGPTTEPFAQAAPNVWSVRYYTRDGKTNFTIRYFARDGSECGPDGLALPQRPKAVSSDARWFPDIERWVDGEIERGTNTQLGRWRWWSKEGVLRHEEHRDAAGSATLVAKYRLDGTLEKKTIVDDKGETRELYGETGTLSLRTKTDPRQRQIYAGVWLGDGVLAEETTRIFDGDTLVAVTEKGQRGVRRFEAKREGSALACVLYQDDGRTLAAAGLLEGVLLGTWRIFDERGTLRREVDTTGFAVAHEATGCGLGARLGEALFRRDEPTFETPPQLAAVDRVSWTEISGARDVDVDRFARLVRGLVAADPLVREYSLRAIRGEVLVDRTVYPATARVVPFLAAALSHAMADRSALLALLQELAIIAVPHAVRGLPSLANAAEGQRGVEDDFISEDATSPRDMDVTLQTQPAPELITEESVRPAPPVAPDDTAALRATAHALDESWPLIFAQFATSPLEDRRRIFELAKLAPAAKPAILEIARRDSDATLRAVAARTVIELPTFAAADAAPLLGDKDALVRATTAIALGLHRKREAPREAVHGLDDALRNWRDTAKRYAELPFADAHVLAQIALAAGEIRTPDARSLTHQLCAVLDEVDGRSALVFARGLLALAFGEPPFDRPYAKRFIEVLEALARSKVFFTHEVGAVEVLEHWRLPRGRIAILGLVAELRGAPDAEAVMASKLK